MYLVFTRVPGESYCTRLRSLLLYLCYVFRAVINSLVCCVCYTIRQNQRSRLGATLPMCFIILLFCTKRLTAVGRTFNFRTQVTI